MSESFAMEAMPMSVTPDIDVSLLDGDGQPQPLCPEDSSQPRLRCYSESYSKVLRKQQRQREAAALAHAASSHANQLPPLLLRRTVQIPRMFCLDSSITKSTEQLGRIRQELHAINQDLSHAVDDVRKRRLSSRKGSRTPGRRSTSEGSSASAEDAAGCCCDNSTDNDTESDDLDDLVIDHDMFELCRSVQQDLRMADMARLEFRTILSELETAWRCEEKDVVTRAGWLRRESENSFEKMSPTALVKLRRESEENAPNGNIYSLGETEQSFSV